MAIHEDIDHTGITGVGGDITTDDAWAAKGDLIVGTGNDTAAILTAGTNDYVLVADSGEATGLKWAAAAAPGAVATDAIWDAAGDLAVGSGANTAAKLAIGAAGGALSVINSAVAWNSGTSFPGSVATGDRYYRTDIDGGISFIYDGTRWVSEQLFQAGHISDVVHGTTHANPTIFYVPAYANRDLWLVDMHLVTYIAATNDGSNYYTFTLNKFNAANANTTTGASFATSGDSASTWTRHTVAVDHLYDASTYIGMRIAGAETGSAGAVYWTGFVTYRLIAT